MAQNLPAAQKAASIRRLLENSRRQMEMALPTHLTADRLLRVAMTSIQRTPALLDCTQQSLLACIMTCAQLGLEPDQFLGQAYLVPFKNVCTLIPGYRGYIALARRSGEVKSVSSQVVYAKDQFTIQYGLDEKLVHVPYEPTENDLAGRDPRGSFRGAYVVFKYKDGSHSFDYMSKADIDRIRTRSKAAKDGPWVTDYDEMAKKTVIKRHIKLTPLSVEFARAAALEDRAMMGESQNDLLGMDDDAIDTEEAIGPSDDDLLKIFADSIPENIDPALLNEFLAQTAESNKATVDRVKMDAAKKPTDFWRFFRAYEKQHKSKAKSDPKQKAATSQKTPAPLKDVFAGDPDDPEFAPDTCPDRPDEIMTKAFCDTKCVQRKGCPVWRGE